MATGAQGPVVRVFPLLLTREGWYREMHHRIGEAPPLLSPVERHVAMLAAARQATRDGVPPPFKLRSRLIPAVVDFYDELMRHRRSVDAFERLMTADLEPSLELDRGARRLLLLDSGSPGARATPQVVTGVIDCVAREGDGKKVRVLEFKTGVARPEHQLQLEQYVAAAREMFSGTRVEGRLLYPSRG